MVDATYIALMLAALVVGWLVSRLTARGSPLSRRQRLGLALGAFCGAMIAAKLPFVLSDWEGMKSGRAWFDNGKTITFGLVGGYFGVEYAKLVLGIHIKTGDAFAAPVAAAIGVGRLACFSAGCCYGAPTETAWGIDFGDGLLRHPTQLYEAAFHFTCAAVLIVLEREGLFRGQLIKLYFIAYFAFRFLTEFIRPEPQMLLGMTLYQWTCLAFIPLFAWLWRRDAVRAASEKQSSGQGVNEHPRESAIAEGERG